MGGREDSAWERVGMGTGGYRWGRIEGENPEIGVHFHDDLENYYNGNPQESMRVTPA